MSVRPSYELTAADIDRLSRLRAHSHRLVERSQASLGRAADLLGRLPFPWPPASRPSDESDAAARAALEGQAADLARARRAMIGRAGAGVERARAGVARTRVLRQQNRALRTRAGGPDPGPATRPADPGIGPSAP